MRASPIVANRRVGFNERGTPRRIADVAGNSGTGGSPVESRYAAMFDRYSGRRRKSAAFFVCEKPSVAALEVVWPGVPVNAAAYRSHGRDARATKDGCTPHSRQRQLPPHHRQLSLKRTLRESRKPSRAFTPRAIPTTPHTRLRFAPPEAGGYAPAALFWVCPPHRKPICRYPSVGAGSRR